MLRRKEKAQTQRKRKGFNNLSLSVFLIAFLSLPILNIYYYQIVEAQEPDLKQEQVLSNKKLDDIEERIFHQNYKKESEEVRLSRLEKFFFGSENLKESIERRIEKISTALNIPKEEEPEIKSESISEIKPEIVNDTPPKEQAEKEGIIGAINQIETKMFNMTFNDYPFQARINALEERLLSRKEVLENKAKPLLERVTILVSKTGLPVQKDDKINLPTIENQNTNTQAAKPQNNVPKSYSINPNTGLLIDEKGETVKDPEGNPISVMIPQPLIQQQVPQQNYGFMPPQQNYGYQAPQQNPSNQNNPYGQQNQFPGQIPYDLFFNQGGGATDPEY